MVSPVYMLITAPRLEVYEEPRPGDPGSLAEVQHSCALEQNKANEIEAGSRLVSIGVGLLNVMFFPRSLSRPLCGKSHLWGAVVVPSAMS